MAKHMVIVFDAATTENYLAAARLLEAEFEAACETSGITLGLHIGVGPFSSTVSYDKEELGEVTVEFIDRPETGVVKQGLL